MSHNAVLAYLDSLCNSSELIFDRDLSVNDACEELLDKLKQLAEAQSAEELRKSCAFFTPFILHHWQLGRLLDVVRCDIHKKLKLLDGKDNAETKTAMQVALILATLIEVINRDGMSLPWQEESRLDGCDFIALSVDEDLNNPQQYQDKLRNRFGIIQKDEEFYAISLNHAGFGFAPALSYKIEPLTSLDKLKARCLKIEAATSKMADELELSWIGALTHQKVASCRMIHLPMDTTPQSFVAQGYELHHTMDVVCANGQLFALERDDQQALKLTKIAHDRDRLVDSFLDMSSHDLSKRIASAQELIWINALASSNIDSCELIILPDDAKVKEFKKDESNQKCATIFCADKLYFVDQNNKISQLLTDLDKLQTVFDRMGIACSRPANVYERPWVESLLGRKLSSNQQQELLVLLRNRYQMRIDAHHFKTYRPEPETNSGWLSGWIQFIFESMNQGRLGGIRFRRLLFFIGDYLNHEGHAWGPGWRHNLDLAEKAGVLCFFANLGWLFFLPRLLRNIVILGYHVLNNRGLSLLEANLDWTTRVRSHWMRFWHEVINDSYWFINGIIFCFYFYGVVNSTTIAISLMTQTSDLVCACIQAILVIRRLYNLEEKLLSFDADHRLKTELRNRIIFEQRTLIYMIFHFLMLLVAMCFTLQSMAVLSPIFPVIGGLCSIIMTIVTWQVQDANRRERAKFAPDCLDELSPEPIETDIPNILTWRNA